MNERNSIAFFYLLKKEVADKFFARYPDCKREIHYWTREDINNFQDDLSETLNERLSERWFYTHLKPKENEKLPRIDMLNILGRYAGYPNWEVFKENNKEKVEKELQEIGPKPIIKKNKNRKYAFWTVLFLIVISLVVAGFYLFSGAFKPGKYTFCFHNKDTHQPICDSNIEIILLNENESPLKLTSNNQGCFELEMEKKYVKFVVKAKNFKTDTIERYLDKKHNVETIELSQDDYALMIQYFATSNVEDWEKRRKQLGAMIDDNAVIFQVTENYEGMEMFNKPDFIDKLTTPLQSLGKIEIVETIYKNDKIINIRFIQK